jgi:hypothetical protein
MPRKATNTPSLPTGAETPVASFIKLPPGVPTARVKPPPLVEIPNGTEIPLIDKNHPSDKKVQELFKARVRIFNLSKAKDLDDYEKVWQLITDQHALCCEHRVDITAGKYTALLRWIEKVYKVPTS